MKRLALHWQISLIAIGPLMAFLCLACWGVWNSYREYADAELIGRRLTLIAAASDLANESQKWRGKSAGYLTGGIKKDSQMNQWEKVTKEIDKLRKVIPISGFDKNYQKELLDVLDTYQPLQKRIASKEISVGEQISSASKKIARLLRVATDTADQTELAGISGELRSLAIIESAKESGGKLRANMTAILSTNKGITDQKMQIILNLMAGVNANLQSKGLVLSSTSQKQVNEFFASKSWQSVNETFRVILKNSQEGGYYRDPAVFFSVITESLDRVSKLIHSKRNYVKAEIEKISQTAHKHFWISGLLSLGLAALLTFLNVVNVKKISNRLSHIADQLRVGSLEVSQASMQISESSSQLSEASIEQASSLQETVSSADEINAMVNKNAASAQASREMSNKSEKSVVSAQETVKQMLQAIDNISESNENVVSQMNDGNQKISEIVKVIREIGAKTDVINDIVFQTKLLSFNASVEAARAGEHGKGFAVVAEEVGNLASMSGNAADEISSMLNDSIKKVEQIVDETKSRVESIALTSTRTMDEGKKVAGKCSQALEEIQLQVSTVNNMVNEITEASNEQAQGLQEITHAMGQLDQVTQSNTNVAQQTSKFAENLKHQSISVDAVVQDLVNLIGGTGRGEVNVEGPAPEQWNNVVSITDRIKPSEETQDQPCEPKSLAVGQAEVPDWNDPDFEDV